MNKASTIIKIFFYYIIITLTAQSLSMEVLTDVTYTFPVLDTAPSVLNVLAYIWAMLQMFFGFFAFSVTGFPPILSLIFFWLPAVYILLYVIGIIRATN